ncbi:MAG: T9SS type A sorting domain-containing protein [Bacteroidetes bacterium]|nr:T9SS type A sorting domain-containing protein [Bacteroidota bacterium]
MLKNQKRKTILLFSLIQLSIASLAQNIPATISLSPSQIHTFTLEKTNLTLNPLFSGPNNSSELYYYNGGVGVNNDFLIDYYRYKFTHPGIANSDITNVTYSFNYAAHNDINHPTQPLWWSQSWFSIIVPPSACNANYWGSYGLSDCLSTENCINNGGTLLAHIGTNGNGSGTTLTQSQSLTGSTLSSLLLDPNDFTIAFQPDGGTTCYVDLKSTISCQVTYNTYPIANNVLSGNQSYIGSANPTLISGTTPTGGNRNTFTYQWQSSLNNSTWTNISGATALTYDPPTITQTTYYRRIAYSAPQPASTSNVITVTINATAPLAPTGLAASANSSSSIYLSWNSSAGATSYDIYSCAGTLITNVTTNNYTHTGLNPLTNYSYKIVAKNSFGSSPATTCANATTFNGIPPTPNGVAASINYTTIDLSWNSLASATSYDVFDCLGNFIANVTTNSFHHTGLISGNIYGYKIVAKNSYGSSAPTACFNKQTRLTDPVITATGSCYQVTLSWNAINGANNYSLSYYLGTVFATTASTSYVLSGLTPGTIIQLLVLANGSGTGSSSLITYTVPPYIATSTSSQLCPGISSSQLDVNTCGSTPTSIQWQSSACGSAFQDIPGATSATYLVTSAAGTGTSFRAKVTNGTTVTYSSVKIVSQYNVCNPLPQNIPACDGGGSSRIGYINNGNHHENGFNQPNVYPNPATKELFVDLLSNESSNINITIYDMLGKIVYTKENDSNSLKHVIDISEFNRGIYYIKVTDNINTHYSKVVFE